LKIQLLLTAIELKFYRTTFIDKFKNYTLILILIFTVFIFFAVFSFVVEGGKLSGDNDRVNCPFGERILSGEQTGDLIEFPSEGGDFSEFSIWWIEYSMGALS
jgi:hypothetical protein